MAASPRRASAGTTPRRGHRPTRLLLGLPAPGSYSRRRAKPALPAAPASGPAKAPAQRRWTIGQGRGPSMQGMQLSCSQMHVANVMLTDSPFDRLTRDSC